MWIRLPSLISKVPVVHHERLVRVHTNVVAPRPVFLERPEAAEEHDGASHSSNKDNNDNDNDNRSARTGSAK